MSTAPVNRSGTEALGRRIGLASLIMMASVFLSRVLGVLRESCIAYFGGAGSDVDAYSIAFSLPEILNHLVAGGYLSVTFIPLLAAHLAAGEEEEGWRGFSAIVTVLTSLLVVLTAAAMLFAPALVQLLAPGTQHRPETLWAAVRMTRIILPAQLFFFLGGLYMAVQFIKGQFLVPALAPLVYNLGIIVGGVLLAPSRGMEGFSWGVLGGAALGNFVLQLFGARRAGLRYRPSFALRHPDFREFILLTLPLMLGLGMTFSVEIFFRFFGSLLAPGAVASLNYGLRLTMLLAGLFGAAAGTASFPFLARLHAQGEHQRLLETLNQTLRRYSCVTLAASALMALTAREIVVVLFQRGAFNAAATTQTALVLQIQLGGAFASAALFILVRGFYAQKSTLRPALYSTAVVLASIPLYWVLARWRGVYGVALGISLSAVLQALVLHTVFNRHYRNAGLSTYLALGRTALVTGLAAALGWAIRGGLLQLVDGTRWRGALLICVAVALPFGAAVLGLARLFRARELDDVARALLARLSRRLRPATNVEQP